MRAACFGPREQALQHRMDLPAPAHPGKQPVVIAVADVDAVALVVGEAAAHVERCMRLAGARDRVACAFDGQQCDAWSERDLTLKI